MSEIYWITRLDSIYNALIIFCVLLSALSIAFFIWLYEEGDDMYTKLAKYCKRTIVADIVVIILLIFTPTSKDAFAIWGIGTTIEYVRNNDKLQQLPDKVVDALDGWVESMSENKERKER